MIQDFGESEDAQAEAKDHGERHVGEIFCRRDLLITDESLRVGIPDENVGHDKVALSILGHRLNHLTGLLVAPPTGNGASSTGS